MSTREETESVPFDTAVGRFILAIAAVIVIILVEGFGTKLTWNWFVPAVFSKAPSISIAEGIGLSLVASALLGKADQYWKTSEDKEKEKEKWIVGTKGFILKWGVILLLGWIVHSLFF